MKFFLDTFLHPDQIPLVLSNILKKNDPTPTGPLPTPLTTRTPVPEPTLVNPSAPVKDNKTAVNGRTTTVLTAETEFHGTLGFSGDLELYGRLEGAIESDNGLLTVGESAVVKALVKAQNIIIYGKVQGDIIALGKVELRGKAQIYGDIKTARLLIEDGVTFVGRSESLSSTTEEKPDFNRIFTKLNPGAPGDDKAKLVK